MRNIPQEHIQSASKALKVLANETRLSILCHLMDGPACTQELIKITGASQSNLSQHLAKMCMLDILISERRGQKVCYQIAHNEFRNILEALCLIYCPEICPPKKQKKT